MDKKCNKCDAIKNTNYNTFRKSIGSKDGFRSECRKCESDYGRRSATPLLDRERNLKAAYKVTPEWFDNKLIEQGGTCALCDKTYDGKRRLSIDHSHDCCPERVCCGKCNRGILCNDCNRKLSFLEAIRREVDMVAVVQGSWTSRALAYLKSYERTQV